MSAKNTKNFKVSEFTCHCGCGFNNIDQRVLDMAQVIRDELGVPVHVGSGSRCARHNAKVGGTKGSKHMLGLAADLNCSKGGKVMFDTVKKLGRTSSISTVAVNANLVFGKLGRKHRKHQAVCNNGGDLGGTKGEYSIA